VTTANDFSFHAGAGTWYITACPVNGFNQVGVCLTTTCAVDGSGPGVSDVVVNFQSAAADDDDPGPDGLGVRGAAAYNLLRFTHNTIADAPQTQWVLRISRGVQGGPAALVADNRAPYADAVITGGTVLVGSYRDALPRVRGRQDAGDEAITYTYTVQLVDLNTATVLKTMTKDVPGYFEAQVPSFATPGCTVVRQNSGTCSFYERKQYWYGTPGYTQAITVHLAPGSDLTGYYILLEESELAAPALTTDSDWRYWASFDSRVVVPEGAGTAVTYEWSLFAEVEGPAADAAPDGRLAYFTYRASVIRTSDNAVLARCVSGRHDVVLYTCDGTTF
jgi:hypothetical protein